VAAIAMSRTRVKNAAFLALSQIGIRYRESSLSQTLGVVPESAPHAGDRFPWLHLKFHAQGPREDLFQRLDDTRFNLLMIGQPAPFAASDQFADILQVHDVPLDPENEAALAAASITSPSYYLLRPAGHIGSRKNILIMRPISDGGLRDRTSNSRAQHPRKWRWRAKPQP
jgi:hypothetical protein